MGNESLFRALGCPTRMKILRLLTSKEMHVSGLARKLGISVPVTARHIKILENAGLVRKRVVGNTYLLRAKMSRLEKLLESFVEESSVELPAKATIFDALRQVPGVDVKKVGDHQYITSIDGSKGYYIYEIDGDVPKKPVDKYLLDKNITLDIKKIVTIKRKKIHVTIHHKENKS
jgi:DNA-binding transcriptional ArsR family regulator